MREVDVDRELNLVQSGQDERVEIVRRHAGLAITFAARSLYIGTSSVYAARRSAPSGTGVVVHQMSLAPVRLHLRHQLAEILLIRSSSTCRCPRSRTSDRAGPS